jgi:hypothetical protein
MDFGFAGSDAFFAVTTLRQQTAPGLRALHPRGTSRRNFLGRLSEPSYKGPSHAFTATKTCFARDNWQARVVAFLSFAAGG